MSPAANKFGEDLVNEEDNESTGEYQPEEKIKLKGEAEKTVARRSRG